MSSRVETRLAELGIELPPPGAAPKSRMRRTARAGNLMYVSGNGPFRGADLVWSGKVGTDLTAEQGADAARVTALNLIRLLLDEGYDLDKLRWVKVLGMINSDPGFKDHAIVLNGFSDVIVEAFGEERGMHARSAVGMASIPWNMALEIEAICELTG